MLKKLLLILLCLGLLLTATACAANMPSAFDNGASRFGEGKEEENYDLPNSGQLLNRLMEEFSGSLEPPFSQKMDDSAFDDAQKRAEEEAKQDPEQADPFSGMQTFLGVPVVENDAQLKQVFLAAYVPSASRVRFRTGDGYKVTLDGDTLNDIYRQLQRQDPIGVSSVAQWKYGTRAGEYIVEISYHIPPKTLNKMKQETPALVDKAIKEMNVDSTDPYTIVCAVNEYLCDIVTYPPNKPYPPKTHTPHGAFNGDGVCEGYATAAKLMLNRLGIGCDIQVGTCTNGEGHAWNLVELDGRWYQMDVTWNDGSKRRTDYLLVTDDYMKQSRTWDESDYPKSATEPYKP